MKNLLCSLSALVLFAFLSSCGNASKEFTLKFNPDAGTKLEYDYLTRQDMTQSLFGQEMSSRNDVGMSYLFEVGAKGNAQRTVSATITGFRMNMEMDGMHSIKFNTAESSPEEDSLSNVLKNIFSNLKGGKFGFTVGESGEMSAVTGIEDMVTGMMEAVNEPEADKADILESVNANFNDEVFIKSMEQSFNIFPGKAVKPGETWTKNVVSKFGGIETKSDNTYTLQSIENGKATLKLVQNILSESASYEDMEYTVSGSGEGTLEVDEKTGVLLNGKIVSDLLITMSMYGMEVPMKVKQTTEIKSRLL